MWAWGALIASVVMGVVAAIAVMKGGKGPEPMPDGTLEPGKDMPQPETPKSEA